MLTRRGFVGGLAAGLAQAGLDRRHPVETSGVPSTSDVVWLNANEYPEGPPPASIKAMAEVLSASNRYHYDEFASFYTALARHFNLKANNILVGSGSSEVLHCAIDAFVNPIRPFVTGWPSFDWGPELAAAKRCPALKIPLRDDHSADVKLMAGEAARAGGGLIYVCNPNNPTSSITRESDIRWLSQNLPPETYLLVDEAYIHFTDLTDAESAMSLVRNGNNRVIVSRTFSKIYGMAGVRVGFVAAHPDLISRMSAYRNNVISIIGVRASLAALGLGEKLIEERRAKIALTRSNLTGWCQKKGIKFIEPHGNFILIDTGRDATKLGAALVAKGIVPGRPFPSCETLIRISIGSESDMEKFKRAFTEVLRA